jgi:hypothetical protein
MANNVGKKCALCGAMLGSNRATFCSPECYLLGWRSPTPDGCILWTGPVGSHGYGNFIVNKVRHTTHRAAYEVSVGPIPDGMMVCHRCDVKTCINPDHLFLGTSQDNMADCARKGRQARKLTDEEVRQIRELNGVSYACLARCYGITDVMARKIKLGEWWRHLPNDEKTVDNRRPFQS